MTINSDPCGLDRKGRAAVRRALAAQFQHRVKATTQIGELYAEATKQFEPAESKKLDRFEIPWRLHLEAAFGAIVVRDLTINHVREYIASRREQEASDHTIRAELIALNWILNAKSEQMRPERHQALGAMNLQDKSAQSPSREEQPM